MNDKALNFQTQAVIFLAGVTVGISFMLVVVSVISAINNG